MFEAGRRHGGGMMRGAATGVVCALAAAGLLGCAEDDCPALKRCDVRERGCQRSVLEAMACMRGGGGDDLPAVRVLSEDQFLERVESYAADDDDAEAQEREAQFVLWNRGLALFGLAPAEYELGDAVADSVAQVGAAYFPGEREIVIIDRGSPLQDERAIELFAHEIVHALQDQELDLRAYEERHGTSFDASLALDALIEGEAVHYQIMAAVELAGRSPDELMWERLYTEWRSETLLEAEADEAKVVLADLRFPYAFGGGFVSQHWLARGRAGIDALYDDPPRTSSEVLFGTNARELEAEQEALSAHAVPVLDGEFVETTATPLGAWIARMYAASTVPDVSLRLRPARELAADVFSVHHDAASDVLVAAWRVRTTEGASAVNWPRPAGGAAIHAFDTDHREAYSVTADPALPQWANMLAWRAPEAPEDSEQDEQAASTAWRLPRAPGLYRACALRRAPLDRGALR